MKQKLRKSRKQRSLFKIVFYSNENGTNWSCSSNTCNRGCDGSSEGVNYVAILPNQAGPAPITFAVILWRIAKRTPSRC